MKDLWATLKYHMLLTGFLNYWEASLIISFFQWVGHDSFSQKAWTDRRVGLPRTGPHSWRGSGPCCPATSSGARGCWHRTWPGCTGGPPASRGRPRAPSSGLWPSEPCGSFWSSPSRPRRRWYAGTRVEGRHRLSAVICLSARASQMIRPGLGG